MLRSAASISRIRDVHDGFVIVGSNFSFYKRNSHSFNLNKTLTASLKPCSLFEGIKIFSKRSELVEIELGSIGGFCVSQMFLKNGSSEDWASGDLDTLRTIMIETVDYAILRLSNKTRRTIFRGPNRTYAKVLQAPNVCGKGPICVPVREVTLFGSEMNNKLAQTLSSKAMSSFSVMYAFGQDAPMDCIMTYMANLQLSNALEYAVYFRREYLPSKGFGLFWKRKSVCDKMKKSPDQEYYPGLISEHGTFYFKNADQFRERHLGTPVTKFSSSLFAEAHKMESEHGKKFENPVVRDFLANKCSKEMANDLEVEGLPVFAIGMVHHLEEVTARLDIVVTNPKPLQFTLERMVEKFHNEIVINNYDELPSCLEMSSIKQCVRESVQLCANTLQDLLDSKLIARDDEIVAARDLTLSLACEAILCFALYGTTRLGETKSKYNNHVLDFLGLKVETFGQGDIFRGLKALKNLVLEAKCIRLNVEKIPTAKNVLLGLNVPLKIAQMFERFIQILSGPLYREYMREMHETILNDLVKQFVLYFVVDCDPEDSYGEPLRQRMQTILDRIRKSPIKRERFVALSSTDAVNFMAYTNKDPWHQAMTVLREDLGHEIYEIFLKRLAEGIDNFMYMNRTFLILSGENDITMVILPFNKTEQHCLAALSSWESSRWRNMFKDVASLFDTGMWIFDLYHLASMEQHDCTSAPVSANRIISKILSGGPINAPLDVILMIPSPTKSL